MLRDYCRQNESVKDDVKLFFPFLLIEGPHLNAYTSLM